MSEHGNHQMALDLLRCHLGLTHEEALQELGIEPSDKVEDQVLKTQAHLFSDNNALN